MQPQCNQPSPTIEKQIPFLLVQHKIHAPNGCQNKMLKQINLQNHRNPESSNKFEAGMLETYTFYSLNCI
ncbi:hypothetical protein NC651_003756 [Populus alba x Populus x berolinensis]|nr:hypothetical protein NC651_003756 [Populus alba x Populus x berolinensis]